MAHFRLTIATDNSCFGETTVDTAIEIAMVLRRLADRIEAGGLPVDDEPAIVHDVNGNAIGGYYHSEEDACA